MKSEWNIGTISEVCSLVTDGSHYSPKSCDSGEYMVSVKDFKGFGFDFSNCKHISSDDYEKMKASGCIPEHGDILIGKDGARFFEDIIIYNQPEKPALLSSIAILRCNPDIILPQFLYYICKNPIFKKDVRDNYGSGSAIPRIVLKDFKRMTISYPDLAEQRRIVASLVAIDDRIALNTAINENLEKQAQAIFKSWFVDFEPFGGNIPNNWEQGNLLEIADYLNGLAMQKFRPNANEIGLPVLKIKELRQGICDENSELCSPNIKPEYIIQDGDVIFSWSGSLLVDFWCGGTCGLNQHLFKITSKKYDKWFYYSWTKYHLNRFIAIAADMATTMGHIKREELAKSIVLIPSKLDYQDVGSLLNPIYKMIITNRIENNRLSNLRDTLLPKLMNGEIDVSNVKF